MKTDVVIIGGGPAGAFLGCYLSKAGVSNVILEKAAFPRAHVGESMVTATTRVFDEIGFLPTMEEADFPKKYGASWHPVTGGEAAIWFKEFPQEGVNQDYTYHVDRSKFDLLLLQHAEGLGSVVHQDAPVEEVLFDGDRAVGVHARIDGELVQIDADVVADASGRATTVGTKLGLRQRDPIFNQFAVHAWYEDLDRGDGPTADFIHIYFLPAQRGWAWQIPITDTVTSVGVVAEREVFQAASGRLDEYFADMVASNVDLAAAMANATPVTDLRAEADYSYSMSKFVGDGWVLIGDAARFVDPIFSSGVSVAAHSAKFASEVIIEGLAAGDVSEARLHPYETRLREGVEVWYEFITLYYKLLHLFTYFIRKEDHRHQVLQLLQGDVYDRSKATVLDTMRNVIETVENTPGHLWKQYLTDIPIDR